MKKCIMFSQTCYILNYILDFAQYFAISKVRSDHTLRLKQFSRQFDIYQLKNSQLYQQNLETTTIGVN